MPTEFPPGYLNDKAGPNRPSLVVIQEYFGLNDHIRSIADRFANEGYVAFAVDLYHGKVATTPADAEKLVKEGTPQARLADTLAAVNALRARDPKSKIGVVGFCMGGGLALAAAAHSPEVRAAVPFYGIPPAELADVTKIRGAVQGHYAKIDDHVKPERVQALRDTLEKAGVSHQIYEYDAQHAFFNDTRPDRYSEPDAKMAWARTTHFLRHELK